MAPVSIREELVAQCHNMTHSGANRTIAPLRLSWYWPGMTRDGINTVAQCSICQKAKDNGHPTSGGRRRLHAGRPWQVVAVDLVGPMPSSGRGNNSMVVLTDHFPRWSDALAIGKATAEEVARALEERVFCYMGLPEQIHTDQGAQFESRLFTELCHLWGVKKTHTSPYHPQSNGVVERNNRTLGN